MITDVLTYWMHIENSGPQQTVFYTFEIQPEFGVPPPYITATIAISAFSQGFVEAGVAGAVGATVKSYEYVDLQGSIVNRDLTQEFINNSVQVNRCRSITFALTASMAWAFALITIYETYQS